VPPAALSDGAGLNALAAEVVLLHPHHAVLGPWHAPVMAGSSGELLSPRLTHRPGEGARDCQFAGLVLPAAVRRVAAAQARQEAGVAGAELCRHSTHASEFSVRSHFCQHFRSRPNRVNLALNTTLSSPEASANRRAAGSSLRRDPPPCFRKSSPCAATPAKPSYCLPLKACCGLFGSTGGAACSLRFRRGGCTSTPRR
jgi:hypothetical protein